MHEPALWNTSWSRRGLGQAMEPSVEMVDVGDSVLTSKSMLRASKLRRVTADAGLDVQRISVPVDLRAKERVVQAHASLYATFLPSWARRIDQAFDATERYWWPRHPVRGVRRVVERPTARLPHPGVIRLRAGVVAPGDASRPECRVPVPERGGSSGRQAILRSMVARCSTRSGQPRSLWEMTAAGRGHEIPSAGSS